MWLFFLPDSWSSPSIPCLLLFLFPGNTNGRPRQTQEPALFAILPLAYCLAAIKISGTCQGAPPLLTRYPAHTIALLLRYKVHQDVACHEERAGHPATLHEMIVGSTDAERHERPGFKE